LKFIKEKELQEASEIEEIVNQEIEIVNREKEELKLQLLKKKNDIDEKK